MLWWNLQQKLAEAAPMKTCIAKQGSGNQTELQINDITLEEAT